MQGRGYLAHPITEIVPKVPRFSSGTKRTPTGTTQHTLPSTKGFLTVASPPKRLGTTLRNALGLDITYNTTNNTKPGLGRLLTEQIFPVHESVFLPANPVRRHRFNLNPRRSFRA
ncbi:MAG TPA: hypothetical protein VGR53_11505 [Nitrososphaerales archaeon]|nr:hypothetical protein [Nitrososphaerales archaeon]